MSDKRARSHYSPQDWAVPQITLNQYKRIPLHSSLIPYLSHPSSLCYLGPSSLSYPSFLEIGLTDICWASNPPSTVMIVPVA